MIVNRSPVLCIYAAKLHPVQYASSRGKHGMHSLSSWHLIGIQQTTLDLIFISLEKTIRPYQTFETSAVPFARSREGKHKQTQLGSTAGTQAIRSHCLP